MVGTRLQLCEHIRTKCATAIIIIYNLDRAHCFGEPLRVCAWGAKLFVLIAAEKSLLNLLRTYTDTRQKYDGTGMLI